MHYKESGQHTVDVKNSAFEFQKEVPMEWNKDE